MTRVGALLLVTAAFAVVDWWAVGSDRRRIELAAKPLTMVLLIGVALLLDPQSAAVRAWFVVGLTLSLAGDVFLMLKRDLFVAGLGAFLVAHLAYVVGMTSAGIEAAPAAIGLGIALIAVVWIGKRIQRSAAESNPTLGRAVAAYVGVISIMLIAAAGTASLVAILGATLFYASDAILGWDRFVSPIRNGRLFTMMTYHAAQVTLVLALITL